MLSDIKYLGVHNTFKPVLKFIQLVRDVIVISKSLMFLPITKLALDEQAESFILREVELLECK